MGPSRPPVLRRAAVDDAGTVARLLDAFNREFDDPTPGVAVLSGRLAVLLAADATAAVLAGEPAVGVALLTFRPNVWYRGPVALLDELYVRPAHRGRGIGSALLAHAEDLVRARGVELLEINVDGDDSGARRLYERHGYRARQPGAREPAYYYAKEWPGRA